jgi:alpha-L-rhamnosidase
MNDFATSRPWHARWVWADRADGKNVRVQFRADWQQPDGVGAVLHISADSRYRVWVNGAPIGDGPVPSPPYFTFYDSIDITEHVRPGTNHIAVVVHQVGLGRAAQGGLIAEITDPADERVLCATDGSWRCQPADAWATNTLCFGMNKLGPFQEFCDLRRLPDAWRTADASGWPNARVHSGRHSGAGGQVMPWCRMLPRTIARLTETPVAPAAVHTAEECIDLANRTRASDLTISLSQVGRPVDWATLANAEALCEGGAGGATLACSTKHLDGVADGRYDPAITLDFGRVLTGYVELDVDCPTDGAQIEIGYAERLVDDRFNNSIENLFADRVTLGEGRAVFRPTLWRSFRYIRLRLKYCEAPLTLRRADAIEVTYPFEKRGSFACDDPRLVDIHRICATTVDLCSIESLMDTPSREQAQWLGDVAAVTVPAIVDAYGDAELPGKFFRQAAAGAQPSGYISNITNVEAGGWQNDIPDYSLWWVIALWHYYLHFGDTRYLHECYPALQRIMEAHLRHRDPAGLIDSPPGWVFIDWAPVDTRGVCAPCNAIFAGACDAAAHIATFKGDTWSADRWTDAAKRVRAAFTDRFVDLDRGDVVDAVVAGERSTKRSEHAAAAAVRFGCVDEALADRILDTVFAPGKSYPAPDKGYTEAQPFFMVVVLEALRRHGRTARAVELIRERWGRMLDRGQTSCSEEWYTNGSWRDGHFHGFQRTHSHAWSACPASFLIKGLAGIEIIEPGCRAIRVNPHADGPPYAIAWPTPHGEVRVQWDGAAATVAAPAGVRVIEL